MSNPVVGLQRLCVVCGKEFTAQIQKSYTCSRPCYMRRFRAIKMLEGTYGYVGRQFKRLPVKDQAA